MQAFFPSRTRKQLKKKFYREESGHPELIKVTLNSQLPLGNLASLLVIESSNLFINLLLRSCTI